MAKTSMIMREHKRTRLVKKHAVKRTELRAVLNDHEATFDEKMEAQKKMQMLQMRLAQKVSVLLHMMTLERLRLKSTQKPHQSNPVH